MGSGRGQKSGMCTILRKALYNAFENEENPAPPERNIIRSRSNTDTRFPIRARRAV